MTESAFLVFLVALASCLALTPAVGWLCRRQGWLTSLTVSGSSTPFPCPDWAALPSTPPRSGSSDATPTSCPKKAGVQNILDVYLPLLVACAAVSLWAWPTTFGAGPSSRSPFSGCRNLPLHARPQIAIISNPAGRSHRAKASFPLTILWFVGLSNAFNSLTVDGLLPVSPSPPGPYVAAVENQRESAAVVIAALAGPSWASCATTSTRDHLGDSGSLHRLRAGGLRFAAR